MIDIFIQNLKRIIRGKLNHKIQHAKYKRLDHNRGSENMSAVILVKSHFIFIPTAIEDTRYKIQQTKCNIDNKKELTNLSDQKHKRTNL